jgi:ABC-2 type transport system permease protein
MSSRISMPSSASLPGPAQPGLVTLTSPKWRSTWARLRRRPIDTLPGRGVLLGVAGTLFLAAAFGVAWRVVRYFAGVPEIGPLLAGKLLEMALLAFSAILLLSNLVTSLSTFFLARDLDLLVSAPVEWGRFYLAKLGETVVHSSWMVALLAVPLLAAYGLVWHGGPLFPLVAAAALLPLFIVSGVIGSAITLLLVTIFPARRTRDLLGLVTVAAVGALVLFIRVLRPEQLARPEGFQNLVDFIAILRAPSHPLLPSEWSAGMLMNWLTRVPDPLPIALLWSTAGALVVIGAALHRRWYLAAFSRAQEGADHFGRTSRWSTAGGWLLRGMPPMRREFILKDLRIFFRDTTQWSQLILIGVLVLVILFNVQALPLFTGERVPIFLVTLIVFLSQGLAGFAIANVAAHFIFPSVSLEGRQLWLLRSSPLDPGAMLRGKYLVGIVPLLVLALGLTITTDVLLRANSFMMVVSVATVVAYTLAVGGLALGMGTLFPQFETENAAQIPTSFGGLVFMLLAVALLGAVITLEAFPIEERIRATQTGAAGGIGLTGVLSFALAAAFCLVAGVLPLRHAVRRLAALEV